MSITTAPPSNPHPDNCPACGHVHLGLANCFFSTAPDNLCECKQPQEDKSMKSKGKEPNDGFENVDGNPVAKRARRVAKAFSPTSRPKDRHLPGLEPKTIPSVHKAIEEYVETRNQRMDLTKVEVERKERLLTAMKKAGIADYNVDRHEAHLEVDESIKARIVTGQDAGTIA